MRLLIASDMHGSLESLRFLIQKGRDWQPDRIVLLGDLVYHGPRNPLPLGYDTPAVLREMAELMALPCPITAVRGNCDAEVDVTHLPFTMTDSAWIEADGLHIYVCHGHRLPELPPVPQFSVGTVILRGHTHVPRGESCGGLHFWNPGSLSLPKQGYPRSYALYEDGTFRVLDMTGQQILSHSAARA
ncbi:MAG: phosphodiesterase [Desulfovibrio sp.]|nr:phosphodiesterase [Desulfovibrio sp.]